MLSKLHEFLQKEDIKQRCEAATLLFQIGDRSEKLTQNLLNLFRETGGTRSTQVHHAASKCLEQFDRPPKFLLRQLTEVLIEGKMPIAQRSSSILIKIGKNSEFLFTQILEAIKECENFS